MRARRTFMRRIVIFSLALRGRMSELRSTDTVNAASLAPP
jgi:hypothetical protein